MAVTDRQSVGFFFFFFTFSHHCRRSDSCDKTQWLLLPPPHCEHAQPQANVNQRPSAFSFGLVYCTSTSSLIQPVQKRALVCPSDFGICKDCNVHIYVFFFSLVTAWQCSITSIFRVYFLQRPAVRVTVNGLTVTEGWGGGQGGR